MRRFLSIFFVILFLLTFAAPRPVHAQIGSAYDLINAVNDFRASYGLAPYEIDGGLMAVAQEQSDYQASILTRTHSRADGSGPGDHGISSENIGGGINVSPQDLINYQWTDYWHTHTLIGYTTGLVGAGITVVDGYAYYTLCVKNTGKMSGLPNASGTGAAPTAVPGSGATAPAGGAAGPQATAAPMYTSTPQEDGSVMHKVQAGQTVWSIAEMYGISIDELARLNRLPQENPVIYVGDELLIRQAFTPTTTPTITLTPTKTLRPTRTPRPDIEFTLTPAPLLSTDSPQLAPTAAQKTLSTRSVGLMIVGISLLGILGIILSRLWSKK